MDREVWIKEKCNAFADKLITIRKRIDELYEQGKITKNRRGRLKTKLKYFWNVYYNKRPDIPEGIKQAYNLLHVGEK